MDDELRRIVGRLGESNSLQRVTHALMRGVTGREPASGETAVTPAPETAETPRGATSHEHLWIVSDSMWVPDECPCRALRYKGAVYLPEPASAPTTGSRE